MVASVNWTNPSFPQYSCLQRVISTPPFLAWDIVRLPDPLGRWSNGRNRYKSCPPEPHPAAPDARSAHGLSFLRQLMHNEESLSRYHRQPKIDECELYVSHQTPHLIEPERTSCTLRVVQYVTNASSTFHTWRQSEIAWADWFLTLSKYAES